MTKKRPPPPSSTVRRRLFVLLLKLVVSLSVFLCFLSLLGPQDSQSGTVVGSQGTRKFLNDFRGNPKIAFLFLVREAVPLDFLWHVFFKNGDVFNFSIYIHSKPGFQFDKRTTRSAFFYGRQLRNSIQVAWGEPSMIEAERLLIEAALPDRANQRFILLSDSCVPLYNFSYIYHYLMSSPRSFVDSFVDVKEDRYNAKMSPIIPMKKWRKGSQWIVLIRRHAEVVVNDDNVFHVFKKFCKCQLMNSSMDAELFHKLDPNNCIPDEHYVQTLLVMNGLEDELERRTLTYSLWNQSVGKLDTKSWHPITFDNDNAGPWQIKEIKDINHVYHESETRREVCRSNSTLAPCYLFARKFSAGAAVLLLTEGIIGPYDANELLNIST